MSEASNDESGLEDKIATENSADSELQKENSLNPEEKCSTEEKSLTAKKSEVEKPQNVKRKVDILLKATGDAPIMKNKKWAVESDKTIGSIIDFIKKYLKLDATDSLYLYVNQSFAPTPDQIIINLFECFGSDGKLVLHYCKTPAWG